MFLTGGLHDFILTTWPGVEGAAGLSPLVDPGCFGGGRRRCNGSLLVMVQPARQPAATGALAFPARRLPPRLQPTANEIHDRRGTRCRLTFLD
jgi:hypothetical protein